MTEQARESMTSKNRSQPHYIPVCLAKLESKDWDFMQRSTILSNSSGANTANNERAQQDNHKFLEAGSPPFLLLMLFGSSCERTNLAPDSCLRNFQGVSGNYCWRSSVHYNHLWFVTSPCDVEPLFALLSQHMWNSTSYEHWVTKDVMMTRTALPLTLRCTNNSVSLQWSHDLLFFL